ncbi:MAG: acyltransferase [Trichodesmium sp. MAG_R04]|nr:acyltransferase [Trichodesmium sp. MAG_R04]
MKNQAHLQKFPNLGQDVTIWPMAKIVFPEVIFIGDSVIIDDFVFIMGGKMTRIGSFVHIASFTSITGGGKLIMEDFTTLSSGVRLFTGNDDYLGGSLTNSTVPYPYRKPMRSFVRIKKHAIVGANSVILPEVTIGEGVAIGANSLIKRDCEPWTIYAGSPAKPIRPRPKEKILELETQLCQEVYDTNGNYIPINQRKKLDET